MVMTLWGIDSRPGPKSIVRTTEPLGTLRAGCEGENTSVRKNNRSMHGMDTSRAKWKEFSINKITKIQISLTYLVLPCKLDISIVVQIDRSLPRRVLNIHHRLLLAHDAVTISMMRGVEIAFAVGAMGSDEAFGVAKAGRRVALGDGVGCACRHSRRVVISGIYLSWRGSGDVFYVLGRRVVLGSMSVQ